LSDRLAAAFRACRERRRAALIGYLTGFDPDREGSRERLFAACEAGLDVLELGVPFSDPTADGPEIQAAMVRALAAGATLHGVLELAAEVRARFELPIVLFGYANPLLRRGAAAAVAEAARAGIDAVLVVDMPPETAAPVREPARAAGLDWIALVAPTTTPVRLRRVVQASSGFVYLVSLRGVTGAKLDVDDPELNAQLAAVRAQTQLPVAVGFGVKTREQAEALGRKVDGVVVGTALVRAGREGAGPLAELVRELAG
jgi:tryptophan synthase alpha chain